MATARAGRVCAVPVRTQPLIEVIAWTPELARVFNDPAGRSCVPYLLNEVRQGIAQAWRCSDGLDELHVITRLDRNPTEWVLCYGQGRGVRKFVPLFIAVARRKGWPVRLHTQSPALVRLTRRIDGRVSEYVVRWPSHGPV